MSPGSSCVCPGHPRRRTELAVSASPYVCASSGFLQRDPINPPNESCESRGRRVGLLTGGTFRPPCHHSARGGLMLPAPLALSDVPRGHPVFSGSRLLGVSACWAQKCIWLYWFYCQACVCTCVCAVARGEGRYCLCSDQRRMLSTPLHTPQPWQGGWPAGCGHGWRSGCCPQRRSPASAVPRLASRAWMSNP